MTLFQPYVKKITIIYGAILLGIILATFLFIAEQYWYLSHYYNYTAEDFNYTVVGLFLTVLFVYSYTLIPILLNLFAFALFRSLGKAVWGMFLIPALYGIYGFGVVTPYYANSCYEFSCVFIYYIIPPLFMLMLIGNVLRPTVLKK